MPTAGQTAYLLPLEELTAADADRAGTKAATLGGLARAGLAVPDGLVLTTTALAATLEDAGLGPDAGADRVAQVPFPPEVEAALRSIAGHFGDATVAVRSSAVDEDAADASFAGQYETVLHVRGAEELVRAVRRCWASAFGDQVVGYRRSSGQRRGREGDAGLAVLVQRQVDADVAGVAFTADPVTGGRDAVLVSAVPGLGDALVSGAVVPDEWSVSGATATPVRIAHQALAEAQATAVAALARRIEHILGGPQDVEWAMAGGRLLVLQARPITALPHAPEVDLPPGTWVKEVERHPEPFTGLGASLVGALVSEGLTGMSAAYGGLIERFEARPIGGEPYMRVVPLGGRGGPPPPWWLLGLLARIAPPLRRRMRTARRVLAPGELERVQERWEAEWRPDLQRALARLRAVDLAALDDEALVAHLDDVHATTRGAMQRHFLLIPPYLVPVHGLITACADLLGWPEAEALQLLAGTSAATSAPSRELAELAGRIRRSAAALEAVERAGSDLAGRLRDADPELGAAFDGWCDRYAQRNVNDDPGSPTLAELPWVLAGLLRDAVHDAAGGRAGQLTARRTELAERARRQLAGRPPAERERFETALAAALRAYPLREDAAFWTASVPGGLLRRAALEIGRRLAGRAALTRAEDAVQLDFGTLRTALTAPDPAPLRAQVQRVQAERAWVRAHPGPLFHGPPPQPFPDLRGLPAAGRRLNEALLWMQRRGPSPAPGAADVAVAGVPAAPGRHTGRVRVVAGSADFGALRPGEVLVCPTTDPAWTVLFGIAGALVTDGGGALSHAAIVAREHAIPAVVGTGTATGTLRDGQVVTVDGTAGIVTVESEAAVVSPG